LPSSEGRKRSQRAPTARQLVARRGNGVAFGQQGLDRTAPRPVSWPMPSTTISGRVDVALLQDA
jgi:hypothetical protein